MARTNKPKSSEVVENNQVSKEPVVVVEKTVKAKKSTKPVEDVVVAASVPLSEPQTVSPVEDVVTDVTDMETSINAQSTEFFAKLNQLGTLISSLKTEYRVMEKKWSRELKLAQKMNSKRKRKSVNRAPSGFVKPTKISDELAKFLEKPVGSEMARTDVTREINKYIRYHNLQDKDNGRKINPDSKLSSLLKLKKTDELTYFNLQRYMSPHFSKAVKEVLVAPVDTA
jgi:upstream activation factor subunit UAF30